VVNVSRARTDRTRSRRQQERWLRPARAPAPATIAGIPSARYVVQTGRAPPPPPKGARLPPGARVFQGPANFLAEFTIGPRLYWTVLHAGPPARARYEAGMRLYYAHAKEKG